MVLATATALLAHPAQRVTLTWDRNPEPDIAGYCLHYGFRSGQYHFTVQVRADQNAVTIWDLMPDTVYYFALTAFNSAALKSPLSEEIVYRTPPDAPPVVSIDGNSEEELVLQPGTMVLAAKRDGDRSVKRVEFYVGNRKLGEVAAAPFRFVWEDVAAGSYTLTTRELDISGEWESSPPLEVTVEAAPVVSGFRRNPEGSIEFEVTGPSQRIYRIWASEDLHGWRRLDTVISPSGSFTFKDDADGIGRRFYKVSVE